MFALHQIVLVAALLTAASVEQQSTETASGAPTAPESAPEEHLDDQITLKSGRVLQGVKVIRKTPFKLVLEVIPAVEPLEIPLKQVVSIRYGSPKRDVNQGDAEPQGNTQLEQSQILHAVKMSPELLAKLAASFTEKPIAFSRQDLLNILRSVGILSGVPVSFGPALDELNVEERILSMEVPAHSSFESFIRDVLGPSVTWVSVEYSLNGVKFEKK